MLFDLLQDPDGEPQLVSSDELKLVNYLVELQRKYENPSAETMEKVTPFTMGDSVEEYSSRIFHINEMNFFNTVLVVQLAKMLPGTEHLLEADLRTLLRAHTSEILMLRAARKYHSGTQSIHFGPGRIYNREFYYRCNLGVFGEYLLSFCKNLDELNVREVEYATLNAIILFSNTPNLIEPFRVRSLRNVYYTALRNYIFTLREDLPFFGKLMGVLSGLKNLAEMNCKQLTNLRVHAELSPFLESLWRTPSY